ncbi:MAG: hypothetical protein KA956_13565 [Pyrinomonadaceae bacterium]|nr:hypothetical protein [Acidobacteriota bacterium]MBP7377497.1 hypothetical protein [Pyrinomonadaceae bacterium]
MPDLFLLMTITLAKTTGDDLGDFAELAKTVLNIETAPKIQPANSDLGKGI